MTSRSTSFQLLRDNRAFRRIWLADLASLMGDWFNTIALYTAIDELLGTSQAVGFVVVAKSLPVVLVSPLAGPLVDRLPRRNLMIGADLVRAVLGVVLIGAWLAGSVIGIYACTALSIAAAGLFLPAKNAVMPAIVPRAELGIANALSGATWSVALAFGAALGGFATQGLGVTAALAIDAATFVLSALWLWGLPPLAPEPGSTATTRAGFRAGIAYLAATPRLVPVLLAKSVMACTAGAVPLLTIYGNRVLASAPSPWIVGVLFAARGIGAASGSLFGRRVFGESVRAMQVSMVGGFVALAVAYGWFALAGSVITCAAAAVVGGLGNALVWVPSSVLLQRECEPGFLGRVFAIDFGAMTLVQAGVIPFVTGLVDADVVGPRGGMAVSALLGLVPGVVLAIWMWSQRRAWQSAAP